MHIGFDASRAFLKERTGTEEYSYQLIRALVQIDRKNRYTLYIKKNPPSDFLLQPNANSKVIFFPYLWTQAGLAIECFRNPPDILFVPAHTIPILRRPSLKTVVTVHDLGAEFLPQYHQFPQKVYLTRSTEYIVKHADYLIAVSENTKNDLITKMHCDPEKITVIYEGYDSEKFKAINSELRIKKVKKKYGLAKNYILFVGTVQPRKNLMRLIEAFSKVEKDKDLQLLIVGKKGWLYEGIYNAPEKFGLSKRVKFLNYVKREDLPVLYSGASCFILPSLYEGFGLPVLEAMACGCPVLVSKTSSLPELVGEAGQLIDPNNVEDIAKSLQLVVSDLQLQKTLRKKGLEQVKKFSWEKCAKETLQLLRNIHGDAPTL